VYLPEIINVVSGRFLLVEGQGWTETKLPRFDAGGEARRSPQRAAARSSRAKALVPEQAVAEALSALSALKTMGLWPGPRDPVSEAAVLQVRRRWAKIQKRAKQAQSR
jgi:hypothetical protein